jgi:hypothetical protein
VAVALEVARDHVADDRLVVDHQDGRHVRSLPTSSLRDA